MISKIIIGTRKSKLALWQANHVKDLIENKYSIPVELKKITTQGDKILDRPLMDIGGKGLFLKEIEDELLKGTIDIAVHSLKDVPYEMPKGLTLCTILKRAEPNDVLVSKKYNSLKSMPKGAVIGSSSLRRKIQIQKKYPHLNFKTLRGNVGTRLEKLEIGEFDGIVLAHAGLKRLGLEGHITEELSIVSSVGQGAICIECLEGNESLMDLLKEFHDHETSQSIFLERYFSKKVQGTCETPVGCYVQPLATDPSQFKLHCFLSGADGSNYYEKELSGIWEEGMQLIDSLEI